MNFYEYKGFLIYPNPRLSLETDTWSINISIRCGKKVKSFISAHFFGTKGETVFHCINFGKKIIDGEIEGFTILDLL